MSLDRSPYYGVILYALSTLDRIWGPVLGQSLVLAAALVMALRHLMIRDKALILALGIVVVAASGASVFTSALLPDYFLGGGIIGLAILLCSSDKMGLPERMFWLALILATALFHKAFLASLALMLICAAIYLAAVRRTAPQSAPLLAGILALSLSAHALVGVMVTRMTHEEPLSPPFLLARVVGDGTAGKYLAKMCPTTPLATCRILSHLPMTENDFLWEQHGNAYALKDNALRRRIIAEQKQIVLGAVTTFPSDQIAATAKNIVTQFFMVDINEFNRMKTMTQSCHASYCDTVRAFRNSGIAQGRIDLNQVSWVILGCYLASLALFAVFIGQPTIWQTADENTVTALDICLLIFLGLLTNAAVSGAISGPFGRYQSRIAWLAPLTAAGAVAIYRAVRRSANSSR